MYFASQTSEEETLLEATKRNRNIEEKPLTQSLNARKRKREKKKREKVPQRIFFALYLVHSRLHLESTARFFLLHLISILSSFLSPSHASFTAEKKEENRGKNSLLLYASAERNICFSPCGNWAHCVDAFVASCLLVRGGKYLDI